MFISAISCSDVNKEFSRDTAMLKEKNERTVNGCMNAVSHGTEPKDNILSMEISSEQKCDGDKCADDNVSICAGKITCRKNNYDEKLPRLVVYCIYVEQDCMQTA